jgi:hypothetical protein
MALRGLTPSERLELLELLEARERNKPEPVVDNRLSIADLFGAVVDEAAQKSGDRVAYIEADRVHQAAIRRHTARLAKDRPHSDAPPSLDALQREYQHIVEVTRADGAPPADEVVRPPAPAPLPDDSLDRLKRAAGRRGVIPRDLLLDSVIGATEQEQQRRAEERAQQSIRAEQDARYYKPTPPEALADFRGHTEAPLTPPSYSDC